MLSRRFKIGNRPRIEHVLKKGRRIRSRFFSFLCLPNNVELPRFALVISKKVSAKAVERNLLRRRTYSVIENELKSVLPLPKEKCYDVVVLCSPRAKDLPYSDLKKDLTLCIKLLHE